MNMFKRPYPLLLLFAAQCCLLLPVPASADSNCLTILSPLTGAERQVIPSLKATLAEYEICMDFKFADSTAATGMLEDRSADGEFLRTSDYQAKVGDFAMIVDEPLVEGYGLLVTRPDQTPSFRDLKGKAVGVRRGFIWQEKVFPDSVTKTFIDDYETGLTLLQMGQISGLLIDSLNYSALKSGFESFQSKRVTAKRYGHIYLHSRHENLVPQLSWAISAWKKDYFK